ncbi:SipW-dependent-type signal peptide-containing protein [Cellulomonas massiliensis]|uniref:SipW-dependent-type signal peptide-containing protein n=1 Tax=Cellulomonas massiliensis TaxID=1465811 RepID=UPI00030F6F55|nr:SipW-dependent-type signal peptide-containing protein [Cellulomonas massiliensis]
MMDDILQEMIDPAPPAHDRGRRRRLWTSAAIIAMAVAGASVLTTNALFTDNATTSAPIETGTIDITASELSFTMPTGGMLPGGAVVAPVTVTNSGSLAYWYAVSYRADDGAGQTADLSDVLRLRAYALSGGQCTLATTETATPLGDTGVGLSGSDAVLFGEPGVIAGTGSRSLASRASQSLCFRVDMADAGNAFQATTSDVVLTFDAVQHAFGD